LAGEKSLKLEKISEYTVLPGLVAGKSINLLALAGILL